MAGRKKETSKRKQQPEWFEEYACGCVSSLVKKKSDLLGYCGKHGSSRRHAHKSKAHPTEAETSEGE